MVNSPTIEMIHDWKKKEALAAHNSLEEFRKPNKLNDLIMSKVTLVVEKLARQCEATEVSVDIAILTELIQVRKLRERIEIQASQTWM